MAESQQKADKLSAVVQLITDMAPKLDDKRAKLLLKWMEKIEKDAFQLAKAAGLNVKSLLDLDKAESALGDEDEKPGKPEGEEPEDEEGAEWKPATPEKPAWAPAYDVNKIKESFGKMKPEHQEHFKKAREYGKDESFNKVKGHFDNMPDEDFNSMFSK